MIYKFCTALLLLGLLVPSAFAEEQAPSQWNNSPEGFFFPGAGSYLGIDIRDITPDRMNALKLKEERGVEVVALDQDAPAGKAGLKESNALGEVAPPQVVDAVHRSQGIPGATQLHEGDGLEVDSLVV